MVQKTVIFARLITLFLCLIAKPTFAEEGTVLFDTEQGIDETQSQAVKEMQELSRSLKNIDGEESDNDSDVTSNEEETVNEEPIEESVEESVKEAEQTKPVESTPVVTAPEEPETPTPEEPAATETPLVEAQTPVEVEAETISPASEGTVLFDSEQGIDETQSPAAKQMQELSESLKNIDDSEPQQQVEAETPEVHTDEKPVEEAEQTAPVETAPIIATPETPKPEAPIAETPMPEEFIEEIEQTAPAKTIPDIAAPETPIAEIPVAETPIPEALEQDLLAPAPEGTVLIDIEQGIDETQNPAIKEIKDLSESFENMEIKTLPDQATPLTITPALIAPAKPEPKAAVVAIPKPEIKTKVEYKASIGPWLPEDGDLRILELRVESYRFDDVIDAYQHEDIVLLPLGLISSLLDISIDVSPDLAKGFILNEKNTFILDAKRNQVFLKGIQQQYDIELVKVLGNDIYIESNLLGKWLDIDFNIDLFASRIWVNSKIKLPFLARIEREQRIKSTLARLNNVTEENYPRHYEPYRNSTVPFIDQTFNLGQRLSDTGNSTTFQYVTHATADLISHESSWYLAGDDQDAVRDFRATFGRTDPDGELLGVLNANEYSFGYVSEPRVNLINIPGKLEPGISVSNFPVGRQVEYDRHRFRGELLPGWEVEIYRNNALIGYQQTAVEGQYDFQDVPLLFGNNHFRLVFYGQKGEVREENIHFLLTQSLTQQGKHYYRASSTTDDIGSNRTSAQYDYGISKNLSSSFNLVSIPLQEGTDIVQHNYLKAGIVGFWDALFASLDFIDDSAGGSAVELDLQTRAGDTIFGFNDITLSKFFSEEYLPSSTELTHSNSLSINTAIPPFLLPRIPVTLIYKIDEFTNGDERVEFTNQLSTNARGFAISNQLISQKTTGQQALQNGIFQLSTNIKDIRIRNVISYSLKPTKELTNVALTIDPGQYEDYRLSFGLNHSLQQDLTEYSATANKLSGKYNLGLGARYNSNGDINLDVTFSVGFGYEPRRKRWEQQATAMANNGSISARVFLDSNQDGLFGNNDTPLENIGFRVNGGYNKLRTDKEGIVFLTGITAHQPANIVLAPETMTDPLWTVALDGVRTVPRPGHAIQLDFPVFMSGEADGTVYLNKNGKLQGVGRVTVELVDSIGQVINTTETSYDGFYVMSHIPLGQHWLRMSKKQLDELNLNAPNDESIEITADEPYVNGIDFTLVQ